MSVVKVGSNDPMVDFRNKIAGASTSGAVVGGIYSASRSNWVYKGLPSDTFVREVSRNLRKDMTSDELKESAKISKFLEAVVDPETNIEELKPQIRDSKELSEAIKASPEEDIEQALSRVFSQPKEKVKADLSALQLKTVTDKKSSRNTALKLVNENFDASGRKLVKNPNTPELVYEMIKSTARKLQAKTVATAAVLSGALVGAMALIVTDVPDKNKA